MTLKNEPRNNHKGWMASKKALLATAAFIIMGGISQAEVEVDTKSDTLGTSSPMSAKQYPYVKNDLKSTAKLLEQPSFENLGILPGSLVLNFAKLAYPANQQEHWTDEEKAIYHKLAIEEKWELCPFNGTTGAANNQVESVSGFIAFKGDHVVIATRGTEMANRHDWLTNIRFSRSPFLRMFSEQENNKISAATAQYFGGFIEGEIANGFLQTHLSSRDVIKDAILKRAEALGKSPRDLRYTVTGHSLGGAKAQLIGLDLVTNRTLGIGVHKVEDSFFGNADDLGMSFYSPSIYSQPKNPGNIKVVVFGSPRVFDTKAAEQVQKILGDAIFRVENNNLKLFSTDIVDPGDMVPSLPPAILGFEHVGHRIADEESQGFWFTRHMTSYVSKKATDDIDARTGFAALQIDLSKAAADISSHTAAPAA